MRKLVLLAVAAGLVAGMIPIGASASHHCRDVFILSGDGSIREPAENTRVGIVNIGSASCTVKRSGTLDLPNVNYLTPGAKHVVAAVTTTNASSAPTGTMTVGGATVALTFTLNDVRGRWESQNVTLGSATTVTATVSGITSPSPGLGSTQSTTYRMAP